MIGPCEHCGLWCSSLEKNHIISRGAHGPEHKLNYIWLGSAFDCGCHQGFHDRQFPSRATCLRIVAKREGYRDADEVLEELWKMMRRPKVKIKYGRLPAPKAEVFVGKCRHCKTGVECRRGEPELRLKDGDWNVLCPLKGCGRDILVRRKTK